MDTLGTVGDEGGYGHELGVTGAVAGDVGGIHALGDDLVVVDENTTDGCLICAECQASLRGLAAVQTGWCMRWVTDHVKGLVHELLVDGYRLGGARPQSLGRQLEPHGEDRLLVRAPAVK